MSPTLKSAEFGEEMVDQQKPSGDVLQTSRYDGSVVGKKSCRYLLPFEHNA